MNLSAPITVRTGSEERSVASGLGGLLQSPLLQFGWGFPTSPSWSVVDLPLFSLFCGDCTDLEQQTLTWCVFSSEPLPAPQGLGSHLGLLRLAGWHLAPESGE